MRFIDGKRRLAHAEIAVSLQGPTRRHIVCPRKDDLLDRAEMEVLQHVEGELSDVFKFPSRGKMKD